MRALKGLCVGLVIFSLLSLGGCSGLTKRTSVKSLDQRITKSQDLSRFRTGLVDEGIPVLRNASPGAQVQDIMNRLVYVSPLKGHAIPLRVVSCGSANAWTDGKAINISEELLVGLWPDKNQIAAVLAHELGHVIAHHAQSRKKRVDSLSASKMLLQAARPALSLVPGGSWASLGLEESVSLIQPEYNRGEEKEADAIGASLAYDAGFDPYGLNRFFDERNRSSSGVAPKSFPVLTNYTSATAVAQTYGRFLLRSSPLYKSHPPSPARKQVVARVAQYKTGHLTEEDLKNEDPWLHAVLKIIEKRSPKFRRKS